MPSNNLIEIPSIIKEIQISQISKNNMVVETYRVRTVDYLHFSRTPQNSLELEVLHKIHGIVFTFKFNDSDLKNCVMYFANDNSQPSIIISNNPKPSRIHEGVRIKFLLNSRILISKESSNNILKEFCDIIIQRYMFNSLSSDEIVERYKSSGLNFFGLEDNPYTICKSSIRDVSITSSVSDYITREVLIRGVNRIYCIDLPTIHVIGIDNIHGDNISVMLDPDEIQYTRKYLFGKICKYGELFSNIKYPNTADAKVKIKFIPHNRKDIRGIDVLAHTVAAAEHIINNYRK